MPMTHRERAVQGGNHRPAKDIPDPDFGRQAGALPEDGAGSWKCRGGNTSGVP